MRIYKSNGKVFVDMQETIELCNYTGHDTPNIYKKRLLSKINDSFEQYCFDRLFCNNEENSDPYEIPEYQENEK